MTSICFGRYGREDGMLIMTTKGSKACYVVEKAVQGNYNAEHKAFQMSHLNCDQEEV